MNNWAPSLTNIGACVDLAETVFGLFCIFALIKPNYEKKELAAAK